MENKIEYREGIEAQKKIEEAVRKARKS